jgi:hypothetical protein
MSVTPFNGARVIGSGYDSFARAIFGVQHCEEIAAHCERPEQFQQVRDFTFNRSPPEHQAELNRLARYIDDEFGHSGW